MNVLQVLTVTTVLYSAFVVFWLAKMEDYLEDREEETDATAGSGVRADGS